MAAAVTGQPNGPALRVLVLDGELARAWDAFDDRVSCEPCGHRSGWRCIPLKVDVVPFELRHRCERFARRRAR